MKPTDKINVEITLAELAKIYAIMGKSNGTGSTLFFLANHKLDPDGKVYDRFVKCKEGSKVIKYADYEHAWIGALFNRKAEQQKQIRELKETITKAQRQIEELEGELEV